MRAGWQVGAVKTAHAGELRELSKVTLGWGMAGIQNLLPLEQLSPVVRGPLL